MKNKLIILEIAGRVDSAESSGNPAEWTEWETCKPNTNVIGFRIQRAGPKYLDNYLSEYGDYIRTSVEHYGLTRIQLHCAPRSHHPIE